VLTKKSEQLFLSAHELLGMLFQSYLVNELDIAPWPQQNNDVCQ